jgi:hypothetical protein
MSEDPNDYDAVMDELGKIEEKLNELKRDFQRSERKQEGQEAFKEMVSVLPDRPQAGGYKEGADGE